MAPHGVEPGADFARGWPDPGSDTQCRCVDPAAQVCHVCLDPPGTHDCCSSCLHWEHPVCQVWACEILEAEGPTLPLLAGEERGVSSEVLYHVISCRGPHNLRLSSCYGETLKSFELYKKQIIQA